MSHAIVTTCMVAVFAIIAFANGWNVTAKQWIDDKINAAKPA